MTKLETSMLFGNTVPPSWGSTNIQKWHWCSYWCIKSRDHQWQFSCKKGVGSFDSLGDKSKKGGSFDLKLHKIQAILTHFWFRWKMLTEKAQLGVIGCKKLYKKQAFSKKEKKRCKKGGLLSGGWHIPANGSVPPSSWPNEVHTYLIPLSQLVISCDFKCSIP